MVVTWASVCVVEEDALPAMLVDPAAVEPVVVLVSAVLGYVERGVSVDEVPGVPVAPLRVVLKLPDALPLVEPLNVLLEVLGEVELLLVRG